MGTRRVSQTHLHGGFRHVAPRLLIALCPGFVLAALALAQPADPTPSATTLRFEVTLGKALKLDTQDGRLLLVMGKGKRGEPRSSIGKTGLDAPPLLGVDVKAFAPGATAVVDQTAAIFPIAHLSRLPAGEYSVQAVLAVNRDLNLPNAPGNLFSEPVRATLDPAKGGTVKLELTRTVPAEEHPPETDTLKWIRLKSELLSKHLGRPMYLRAGVVLPRNFARDKDRRYPLRVHIGGYGTRYTAAAFFATRRPAADDAALRLAPPRRCRSLWRPVPGELREQRPLWRRGDAGADSVCREDVPLHRQALGPRAGWRLDRRLGLAGLAGLLSRLLQRLLVAVSRPRRFPCV